MLKNVLRIVWVMLCSFALYQKGIAQPKMSISMQSQSQESIIKNGDFSNWAEDKLLGWTVQNGAKYEIEKLMSFSPSQSLKMFPTAPEAKISNARIFQDVTMNPNSNYSINLVLAQKDTGTVAVRVQPVKDGKILGGEKTPLNWSVWSWSFPWHPLSLRFKTGSQSNYRVTIQYYGKVGNPCWIDGVKINRLGNNENVAIAAKQNSFIYSQSIMKPFDPTGAPESSLRTDHIDISGTRGDFSPAFVGFHSGGALNNVNLEMGKVLTGPGGATIDASNITIRMVAEQSLLLPTKPRTAREGENLGWWVTAHIPEAASSGEYRGMLYVKSDEKVIGQITYNVRVETFSLPQPNIPMFVYHAETYFPPGGFLSAKMREAYYRDMKDHGMNTVTIYNTPDVNGKDINFDHDYRYSSLTKSQLDQSLKKSGFTVEEVEQRSKYGLNQTMQLILDSGLGSTQFPVLWLPIKSGNYGFGDMPSEALKKSIDQWKTNKNWPTPLLYVLDEPSLPDRITAAKKALDRINKLNLPIKTVTAGLSVNDLGKEYDVWIQSQSNITPEMLAQSKEYKKELWAYNCNMPTSNGQFTRAFYGFWAYRSGVKGVGLWAYYDAKNWFIDQEGQIHGKNGPANLSRICPSPEGPEPTISWETTREGVTDYRYATLYDQLIKTASSMANQLKADAKTVLPKSVFASLEEGNPPQTKDLKTDSEKAALKKYMRSKELSATVTFNKKIRQKVIESIPYDAMAVTGNLLGDTEKQQFAPAIGIGDKWLMSEHKRDILRAYIRLLSTQLASN